MLKIGESEKVTVKQTIDKFSLIKQIKILGFYKENQTGISYFVNGVCESLLTKDKMFVLITNGREETPIPKIIGIEYFLENFRVI